MTVNRTIEDIFKHMVGDIDSVLSESSHDEKHVINVASSQIKVELDRRIISDVVKKLKIERATRKRHRDPRKGYRASSKPKSFKKYYG